MRMTPESGTVGNPYLDEVAVQNENALSSPALGFYFDTTNVADQLAACTATWLTYKSLLVTGAGFLLEHFGDPQPFKDSATTVLSIVAQALMSLAFMEQWILWILTNAISIVMWAVLAAKGGAHAEVMVIMWSFYLLNSLNGFRIWRKLSASDNH